MLALLPPPLIALATRIHHTTHNPQAEKESFFFTVILIAIFAVVGIAWVAWITAGERLGEWLRRRPQKPDDPLAAIGPDLESTAALKFVSSLRDAIIDGIRGGDVRALRPYLSDGLFEGIRVRLALSPTTQSALPQSVPTQPELVHARTEELHDVIRYKLLPWVLAPVPASQPRAAEAGEIWTLARRIAADGRPGFAAIDGRCPKCHEAVPVDALSVCPACGARAASALHSWVLASAESGITHRQRPFGDKILEPVRALDPGVTHLELVDRATYLFWRWVFASAQNVQPTVDSFRAADSRAGNGLSDCATEGFLRTLDVAERHSYARVEIDSVMLKSAQIAEADATITVTAEVIYRSSRTEEAPMQARKVAIRMARAAGARRDATLSPSRNAAETEADWRIAGIG